MSTKELALKNHARGLWTDEMIARLVAKGKITTEEYHDITGLEYPAEEEITDSEALAIIIGEE